MGPWGGMPGGPDEPDEEDPGSDIQCNATCGPVRPLGRSTGQASGARPGVGSGPGTPTGRPIAGKGESVGLRRASRSARLAISESACPGAAEARHLIWEAGDAYQEAWLHRRCKRVRHRETRMRARQAEGGEVIPARHIRLD